MDIRIDNDTEGRIPRQHALARMRRMIHDTDTEAVSARVTFSDVNGPKGGVDIRCALLVSVPGLPPIRAERVETTARLAFDASYASAVRQLEQGRRRRRDVGRRPKKYFTAKRFLLVTLAAVLAAPMAVFAQAAPPAGDLELKAKKKTTVVAPKPGTGQATKDAETVKRQSEQRRGLGEAAKTSPPSRPDGDVTGGVQSKGIQRELGK